MCGDCRSARLPPRPLTQYPFWRWLPGLLAASCISCSYSEPLYPVQGKVLYRGQPLTGAVVTLHRKENADITQDLPIGRTGDDGTFTVTTGQEEGARDGDYILTLVCPVEVSLPKGKAMNMAMGPEYDDRFKGAYANRNESKLQVSIQPGPNQLEPIDLK